MRAICINNKPLAGFLNGGLDLLEIGEEYHVLADYFSTGIWVETNRGVIPYAKKRFALISEIDERDLAHAEPIESTFILKEV